MTTEPELVPVAQLRELLAKATPGPWEVLGDNQGHPCGLEWTIEAPQLADEDYTGWIAGVHGGDGIATTGNPGCRADAELIAAAVNALPALLDELDALRALRAPVEAAPEATVQMLGNLILSDVDSACLQLVGQRVRLLAAPAGGEG